jgi:hypothetical protein
MGYRSGNLNLSVAELKPSPLPFFKVPHIRHTLEAEHGESETVANLSNWTNL